MRAADQEVTLERERRNVAQVKARDILIDYRKAVLGTFDPLNALVACLPKLSPDSGSTAGATGGSFGPLRSLKSTGERSPSPDGDERVCCSGTGYDAGVSLVS